MTFPSRRTLEADGNIFLNPYIKASDLAPCANVMAPVRRTTNIKTKARYKLGKFPCGWTIYITIQRIDPTHNIIANQFVIYFKNLIHAGSFFFSGSLLSPY